MSTYLGTHVAVVPSPMPAPNRMTPRLLAPPPVELHPRSGATRHGVAEVLADLPAAWTGLHDVSWSRSGGTSGHVAVGPGGVFVVQVISWDGELSLDDEVLRVGGRARARAVAAAKDAARAVVTTIPLLLPEDVHAVVCLESDQAFVGEVRGTVVCTTATLGQVLEGSQEIFAPDHTALIALFIRNGMALPAEPGRHAAHKSRRPRRRTTGGRRRAA